MANVILGSQTTTKQLSETYVRLSQNDALHLIDPQSNISTPWYIPPAHERSLLLNIPSLDFQVEHHLTKLENANLFYRSWYFLSIFACTIAAIAGALMPNVRAIWQFVLFAVGFLGTLEAFAFLTCDHDNFRANFKIRFPEAHGRYHDYSANFVFPICAMAFFDLFIFTAPDQIQFSLTILALVLIGRTLGLLVDQFCQQIGRDIYHRPPIQEPEKYDPNDTANLPNPQAGLLARLTQPCFRRLSLDRTLPGVLTQITASAVFASLLADIPAPLGHCPPTLLTCSGLFAVIGDLYILILRQYLEIPKSCSAIQMEAGVRGDLLRRLDPNRFLHDSRGGYLDRLGGFYLAYTIISFVSFAL